jgi:hypothetical protein
MLVVKLEVWPGGDEKASTEIGRLEISNLSGLAPVSDYDVRLTNRGEYACNAVGHVEGHERSLGAWALVRRALEAVKLCSTCARPKT